MRMPKESEHVAMRLAMHARENVLAKIDRFCGTGAGCGVRDSEGLPGGFAKCSRGARRRLRSMLLRRAHRWLPGYRCATFLLCIQICCGVGFCQQGANSKKNLIERARTLAVAGKLQKAEALLNEVLHRSPNSANAHFLLGYVYFREKRARQSLAEFTAGARTQRPGVDDLRVVASDYVLLGDYTDAAKWFGVVASEDQKDPDNWYLLGRAQYYENHFRHAIASFRKALALRPRSVRAENNLGLACEGMNEMKQASKAFHLAIEWQGTHPNDAQPFLNLGSMLINGAHPKQALHYLKTAVNLAPRNPKIREQLARAYKAQKDFARAQHQLEAAVKIAPKAAGLHYELGQIYWREGFHQEAQKQFKICAQLNGTHSSVQTPNPYSPN